MCHCVLPLLDKLLTFFKGFGEGDRTMREDREDREAYRRGPMEGQGYTNCYREYIMKKGVLY